MTFRRRAGRFASHVRAAYRSGLEEKVSAQIAGAGIKAKYEEHSFAFEQPAKPRKYTPDFILPNGIVIETKGYFVPEDRNKHAWVKAQHPDLDIRFVFSRSATPLYKGSSSTYASWCEKEGFKYADKLIPQAWLTEPKCSRRLAAIKTATAVKATSKGAPKGATQYSLAKRKP